MNHFCRKVSTLGVCLLGLLRPTWVQADEQPARALSVAEALQLAERSIPLLVRARAEQRVTESGREGAALWLSQNPYATVMIGRRRETTSDPAAVGLQYQVHIEQALEIAGQRWARLAAVNAKVDVAQAQTGQAQIESRALLQTVYMQASVAAQRVAVSQKREALADQLLESAKTRHQLGATGELEVNLAQIEKGRVQAERVQAEVQAANRRMLLSVLCGLSAKQPLHLTTGHADPPVLLDVVRNLDALYAMAEQGRADLRAVLLQKNALLKESAKFRREAIPSLVLGFDFQRDLPGQEFLGGTIGLSMPLWNRNQGPMAQLAAQEWQRQSEERLLRNRMQGEVAQAQNRLLLLYSQVTSFQQEVFPPSERNIELLRRGWQAGKFDLFRVITASRELADTRLRLLDLLEDLWSAAFELERSVGGVLVAGEGR